MADPRDVQGQLFFGTIKMYSISKGYGFVISDKVDGDLFFLHKNLPKEVIHRTQDDRDFKLEGREVAFTVEINEDDKPCAYEMRLLADIGPSNSAGKGKGKIRGGPGGREDDRPKGGRFSGRGDSYGGDDRDGPRGGRGRFDDDDYDRRGKGDSGRGGKPDVGFRAGDRGKAGKGRDPYTNSRDRDYGRGDRDFGRDRDAGRRNPYDEYFADGKGNTGISMRGQQGKGRRDDRELPPRKPDLRLEPGKKLLDERCQARMKSYSNGSKWGFAIAEPSYGDFGDIFVHANNMEKHLAQRGIQLRDDDVVECDLEEVDGKPVARNVTLVPQEPSAYSSQWMRGALKNYNAAKESGIIEAPRIWGEIPVSKADMAKSMWTKADGNTLDVMFRLTVENGEATAKYVNTTRGLTGYEAEERARDVIDSLHADGFLDSTAKRVLQDNDPAEFIRVLPELAFYRADNPSSFILGALKRTERPGDRKGDRDRKGKGRGPY